MEPYLPLCFLFVSLCVCLYVSECDVKKLYSNRRCSLDALSHPLGDRKREGRWIYFSSSVVYLSLSVVAAAHYRRCVCACACVCLAVAVNRSPARIRLMYSGIGAEHCSAQMLLGVHDWIIFLHRDIDSESATTCVCVFVSVGTLKARTLLCQI